MIRRLTTVRLAFLAFGASLVVPLPVAMAGEAAVSADIVLEKLAPRDMVTILRSIGGVRGLETVGDHTVRVSDVPERVALARIVVEVAENPSRLAENVPPRPLPDGSVLASVHLLHAAPKDVMVALRTEVGIARIAVNDARSTVIVRDSPEQVAAALTVVRRLEAQQDRRP